MNETRRRSLLVALLIVGASAQVAIGSSLALPFAAPDIALATMVCACLFVDAGAAAGFGFLTGLIEAAYVGQLVGTFAVSRTLAAFTVGLLEDRVFRNSVPLAVTVTFVATALTQIVFFVFAPQPHALHWFQHALGGAMYNGVLGAPIYFVMRRLVGRPRIA